MKKFLLPGMLATMMFAACTNEDIVSQQTAEAPKADLSNRPVVGMVDLNFGPQTRATLLDGSFGLIEWTEGDKIGARIIDNRKTGGLCEYHAVENYDVADYAWSNYRYDYNATDNTWNSGALMVEGNYMFYAPYNAEALYRTPLEIVFPIEQSAGKLIPVTADAKYNSNTDAVQRFYESNNYTIAVGHTFVSADDENAGVYVSPRMTQLYAYPQLTLVNKYEVPVMVEDKETGDLVQATDEDGIALTEGKPLKIDQITVYSDKIFKHGKINQKALVEALKLDIAEVKGTKDEDGDGELDVLCPAKKFENWTEENRANDQRTEWFLKNARTSGIINWAATNITVGEETVSLDGKVVINLDEPVTIPAGYKVSLNVVLPAENYTATGLAINVRILAENSKGEEVAYMFRNVRNFNYKGDEQNVDGLHYAVAKRYAEQEYNYPASALPATKTTAGALATFDLKGELVEYDPEVEVFETEGIHNYNEFVKWLDGIKDNSTSKVEGEDFKLAEDHTLLFDAALKEAVNTYLNSSNATLSFTSALKVVGGDDADHALEINGDKYPKFGKLIITKGYVKLNGVEVSEVVLENGAVATYNNVKGNIKASVVNGDVTKTTFVAETVTFNGDNLTDVTVIGNAKFNGNGTLTNVSVTGQAEFNGENTLNGVKVNGHVVFNTDTNIKDLTAEFGFVRGGNVKVLGENAMTNALVCPWSDGKLIISNDKYAPAKVELGYKDGQSGVLEINANWGKDIVITTAVANPNKTVNNSITVNAGATATLNKLDWTNASIINKGTIASNIIVPAGMTYEHKAGADVEGVLTNNGKINNYGELTAVNNGEIIAKNTASRTTVTGSGKVNNTAKGIVINNDNNEVYIETGAFTNDNAYKALDLSHAVNTLYITGTWTVNSDLTVEAPTTAGFTKIIFKGGNLSLGSATLNFNNIPVEFAANSTWTGRLASVSIVENLTATLGNNNGNYYTWTVKDIEMESTYSNAVAGALKEAAQNGGKIKLNGDVALSAENKLTVGTGAVVELDLNGMTLTTSSGTGSGADDIVNNGTLTIKNGNIESVWTAINNGDNATLNLTNCNVNGGAERATVVYSKGILNITGGTYTSTCADSDGNSTYVIGIEGGEAAVTDATVKGANQGAICVNAGKATISGGSYTAGQWCGLWVSGNGTVVNYKNATFSGKEANVKVGNWNNGLKSVTVNGTTYTEEQKELEPVESDVK